MKIFKLIYLLLLLAFICSKAGAQTRDTITATYAGSIYSHDTSVCFAGGCSYTLSVPIPPNFTITDVLFSFNYSAVGSCNLNQAGWDIIYRTCRSPKNLNIWNTCTIGLPGVCILQNLSMYDDIQSCILPAQPTGYNMDFTLTFYRCAEGVNGDTCGPSCFVASSPWSMRVEGEQDTTTGIIEPSLSNLFTVYPNPANTQLTLYSYFIHSKNVSISIVNLLGQKTSPPAPLLQERGAATIDVSMLPAGIYFLQFTADNRTGMARFVKE